MRTGLLTFIMFLGGLLGAGCGGDTRYHLEIPAPRLHTDCEGQLNIRSIRVRLAESVLTGTSFCDRCIQLGTTASTSDELVDPLAQAGDLCPDFKISKDFDGKLIILAYSNAECSADDMQACDIVSVEIATAQDQSLPTAELSCDEGSVAECR